MHVARAPVVIEIATRARRGRCPKPGRPEPAKAASLLSPVANVFRVVGALPRPHANVFVPRRSPDSSPSRQFIASTDNLAGNFQINYVVFSGRWIANRLSPTRRHQLGCDLTVDLTVQAGDMSVSPLRASSMGRIMSTQSLRCINAIMRWRGRYTRVFTLGDVTRRKCDSEVIFFELWQRRLVVFEFSVALRCQIQTVFTRECIYIYKA